MTIKEKAIRLIEALPDDATMAEIVKKLEAQTLETTPEHATSATVSPPAGAWELLEEAAGTLEMPADWASEHDHYLYGTPKRASPA